MSGSVSAFDITRAIWNVSMLMLLGMRSLWIHWMWGWMMGVFFMAYMGKWVRRSNIMPGADCMRIRFTTDTAEPLAHMPRGVAAAIAHGLPRNHSPRRSIRSRPARAALSAGFVANARL